MNQAVRQNETRTYTGKVERYISGPTTDGYAILSMSLPNGTKMTVKGKNVLCGFGKGDKIIVKGRETRHPVYGNQIQAFDARASEEMMTSTDGLAKWLAEAGIEGIGAARAKEIAKILGADAIDRIVQKDPVAVSLLGIRFNSVHEALVTKYGEAKFGPKLAELGLGRQTRVKVYQTFGAETGKVIEKNPYRLITEVEGISFLTADKIARNSGISDDSEDRIKAAACHVLRESESEGHTWQAVETVIADAAKLTGIDPRNIARVFDNGNCPGAMNVKVRAKNENIINAWSLNRIGSREEEFARMVKLKLAMPKLLDRDKAEALVKKHEGIVGITLNEKQREAAIMAIIEPLCVITGGPGRGKTTVLDIIVRCWKELGRKIDLGSPTGKAAQRMCESTGLPAQTIHRMLGAAEGKFQKNAGNPLSSDAIAIDETSMLDIYLAWAFSSAWNKAQILLIGDAEQIASVGPGKVFRDLVESPIVPTVRLIENRRQKEGSSIAAGGEAICQGKVPEWKEDLQFIERNTNLEIAEAVEEIFTKEVALGNRVQILSPGHASEAGTIDLNERLRLKQNDGQNIIRINGGASATIGDEVIQLDNCDKRKIANGDVGRIKEIKGSGNSRTATVAMQTPDGIKDIVYTSGQFSELGLAWALSVHKAQGSEYDVIIMTMTTSHWKLLRRTLFNTGITRAKQNCYVIGQKRAVLQAVRFDDSNLRQSRLKYLLEA